MRKMTNERGRNILIDDNIQCLAGEVLNLKCETNGGNPAAKLEW